MRFTKLHGTGNDFIVIDARELERDWARVAAAICERHTGAGADGLLLVQPSKVAALRMALYNADGSEAEMSGNGLRCFVKFAVDRGLAKLVDGAVAIETLAGVLTAQATLADGRVVSVRVGMGRPRFAAQEIPVAVEAEPPIQGLPIEIDGTTIAVTCVSMGNPHAVQLIDGPVAAYPLSTVGPKVERHALFPSRVNFSVARALSRGEMESSTWERGVGETLACGTGASAVLVAARLQGLVDERISMRQPGGLLELEWDGAGEVYLTGPAVEVYEGEWPGVKELKRIAIAPPRDTYGRAQRGLVRNVELSEVEFREIEREHAGHIVVDGEAVLIAEPRGYQIDLHFAFPDRDAFVRQFPPLFGRIASVVRPQDGALGYRLRLRATADRPYVEPVLLAQDFTPRRDWWRMTLDELPDAKPNDDIAPGFILRPAGPGDAEAIAAIDAAAFGTPWLTAQETRGVAGRGETLRALEETGMRRLAGYLRLRGDFTGAGYVSDVAVHDEYQRRGLGEAMLRWALAWFAKQGYGRAALTVNADNAPAIALYRKLGFAAAEAGVDYRRPIDEDELRQQRERAGVHIRVRRRS